MAFDEIPKRSAPAWTAAISACARAGRHSDGMRAFREMLADGVTSPNAFVLAGVLRCCAGLGNLNAGKRVHGWMLRNGVRPDVVLCNAVVNMYAKCGDHERAKRAFGAMAERDAVSWSTMVAGYAQNGREDDALEFFRRMLREGVAADQITFIAVLSACSHSGLVTDGDHFFRLMQDEYKIAPSIEHYNCMVDLYGRAGLVEKAKNFIEENNINDEAILWKTLLSTCRLHKHIEYAKLASEKLIQLERCDAGSYVLMSNMYATSSKWLDTFKLRSLMREKRVRKQPGQSWIHLKNAVHTFVAGDVSHPRSAEIYAYLERLMNRLHEMGFTSRTDLVGHDVEEEQRETSLKFHSEKLAIAFGIISTPFGTQLRIFKNLRVCEDCHEAIKVISKAEEREIIVRDLYRFHHFKDGRCSCEDFW
ncbi:hypothetical protein PR202_gb12786 [Eleusine coracana subsp. coracana]|uniref:DYW domain-containing protein n=1 Tax=Eleusine coracana subsp. coracana TaxID=191504 RepID=A0AAV5ENN6_ELECO|nr:hypothetical protein PR202_gb12786 [Eleusine coracana subsp. coracana]